MKACQHPGVCKLCGELKPLTFEHVPPKHAFNSFPVMYYSFDEAIKIMAGADGRKPWDFEGLKGKKHQAGSGAYYLCRSCNSNTGSWYIREYTEMTQVIHSMLHQESVPVNAYCSFQLLNRYPLRIFKAIMTMFCDINHNCFGDESLRSFLMDKEISNFDSNKYELYMYLVSPSMKRINGISAIGDLRGGATLITEISSYPIGLTLYIDRYKEHTPFGVNISSWANYSYDEKCNIEFIGIPYIELNSQIPTDFRSREEIENCIKKSSLPTM